MKTNKDKVLERFPNAVCECYEIGGYRDYSISVELPAYLEPKTRTNVGVLFKGDIGRHAVLGYGNTEPDAWRDAYNRIFPLNLVTGTRKPIF